MGHDSKDGEDPTDHKPYKLSYSVGVAESTNKKYRPTMEDVHTYVENFVEKLDWGYFAVFDGHAGQQAAKWCGQNLHSIIEKKILENEDEDVRDLLNDSFVEADQEIVKNIKGSSGCTAAVAIIRWELAEPISQPDNNEENDNEHEATNDKYEETEDKKDDIQVPAGTNNESATAVSPKKDVHSSRNHIDPTKHKRMLYTANVGDSRIVLFRNKTAIRLTYDHKASDKHEINRIEKSGGLIMKSRVNGMLAVTRSLGDQFFKDLVIGNPYTTSVELKQDIDEFLIIACDGLWDVVSDQQACELIQNIPDANLAAKKLVDFALAKFTTDNITVMVVKLK